MVENIQFWVAPQFCQVKKFQWLYSRNMHYQHNFCMPVFSVPKSMIGWRHSSPRFLVLQANGFQMDIRKENVQFALSYKTFRFETKAKHTYFSLFFIFLISYIKKVKTADMYQYVGWHCILGSCSLALWIIYGRPCLSKQ